MIHGRPNASLVVNGQRQYAGLLEALTGGITVDTLGGNDTVTIDFANGSPVPAGGMHLNGNGGVDSLIIQNSSTVTYTPDAANNPAQGTLNIGATNITFEGMEFITPVAPVISGVSPSAAMINEDGSVTLSGDFVDPGSLSSHTVEIDWGDGSSSTVVNLEVHWEQQLANLRLGETRVLRLGYWAGDQHAHLIERLPALNPTPYTAASPSVTRGDVHRLKPEPESGRRHRVA